MKETKFHKMEKEIAALKQEIAELRTQINLLAARVPFIYYTQPHFDAVPLPIPWQPNPFITPTAVPVNPRGINPWPTIMCKAETGSPIKDAQC